jgi:hypothetical protein
MTGVESVVLNEESCRMRELLLASCRSGTRRTLIAMLRLAIDIGLLRAKKGRNTLNVGVVNI